MTTVIIKVLSCTTYVLVLYFCLHVYSYFTVVVVGEVNDPHRCTHEDCYFPVNYRVKVPLKSEQSDNYSR